MNWIYFLAEREGPHAYGSYGEALIDSLILLFSGWSLSDPPATRLGFLAAFTVLVAGIAFVAMLIGNAASFLVNRALNKDRGLGRLRLKNHVLVCNWNDLNRSLVDELLSDEAQRSRQIVIVADLPQHPYPESGVSFVSGSPTRDEVLTKACVDDARTAIITGDGGDVLASDSLTILTALAVEARNPRIYSCAMIYDPANRSHLRHANVDEVACVGEITAGVLAQSALNHGLTALLRQFMTFGDGCEIYKVRMPAKARGAGFVELAKMLLDEHGATLLALERGRNGYRKVVTCASEFDACDSGDALFVYAESIPNGLIPATEGASDTDC
jgi:voltage-gated potassium channel